MTSKSDAVDLREVPIGVTVVAITVSGSEYRITRQPGSSDAGHGVITHLYVSVTSRGLPRGIPLNSISGMWRIARNERWIFNGDSITSVIDTVNMDSQ